MSEFECISIFGILFLTAVIVMHMHFVRQAMKTMMKWQTVQDVELFRLLKDYDRRVREGREK